jgi:hypothetical protein
MNDFVGRKNLNGSVLVAIPSQSKVDDGGKVYIVRPRDTCVSETRRRALLQGHRGQVCWKATLLKWHIVRSASLSSST